MMLGAVSADLRVYWGAFGQNRRGINYCPPPTTTTEEAQSAYHSLPWPVAKDYNKL